MPDPETPTRPPAPCPVCGRPATPQARPFCSPRCRQVDLGRWLSGAYAIPAGKAPEEEAGEVWTGERG
ncbi:MAG: DNA gyrase inhibitor YacG [Acetobacteraceae bacterium]|nr:DNA gyrase inhibitor YacG [Acetobacteraceae bacterium]